MHSNVELQNIENVHSNLEDRTHEENEEVPNEEMHIDNMEIRKEPVLAKYVRRHHPTDQIIGDKGGRPMTRNKLRSETCFLSKVEPKTISEALQDDDWYSSIKEEIEQIEKNKIWTLVPRQVDKNVIGTKCMLKNKLDENGEITRNKVRLVCKGHA